MTILVLASSARVIILTCCSHTRHTSIIVSPMLHDMKSGSCTIDKWGLCLEAPLSKGDTVLVYHMVTVCGTKRPSEKLI